FALGTVAHFLFATAPSAYLMATCDMLSIAYVVPAIIGGGALAAIAWFASGERRIVVRGGLLAAGGAMTFVAMAGLFPQCMAGPYAMADALVSLPGYMDTISEA